MKARDITKTYTNESPIATELRRMYHNTKRKLNGDPVKSFLITSSDRREGKSTIASHFALTIAQYPRKKVLMVDSDMRRPTVYKLFGLENEGGLMECLSGYADPLQMIKNTALDNLHVITAGGKTDSPATLFESESLSEFFKKITFYYDVIIVDSAPVLAVSDTLFLCPEVDSVLFVVLAGITPRKVALRSREILIDSGATIAGMVVNNALQVLPYYYDYKYYGYAEEGKESSRRKRD